VGSIRTCADLGVGLEQSVGVTGAASLELGELELADLVAGLANREIARQVHAASASSSTPRWP
jgi:hypothetical protein